MTHHVVVTKRAKDDLRRYYVLASRHAPETAVRWLHGFEAALQTLSSHPERRPLAPEDDLVDDPIRQFFFGKGVGRHRALFTIEGDCVIVLHVRRGTMDKAGPEDLLE